MVNGPLSGFFFRNTALYSNEHASKRRHRLKCVCVSGHADYGMHVGVVEGHSRDSSALENVQNVRGALEMRRAM